jgi:GH24 family phage-related lysozyme (muramidase)
MGLVDMAFNMGLTKLKKFVDMKKGLDANDYTTVAKEAKDSDWFRQHQVLAGQRDHRGKRTVALFKKAIYPEGMIR